MWAILHNPLVILVPFALVGLAGWNYYMQHVVASPSRAVANLLPNGDMDQYDAAGVPAGWKVTASNPDGIYMTQHTPDGYFSRSTFGAKAGAVDGGYIAVQAPKVPVAAGQTYLYKSFYKTSGQFGLWLTTYNLDGTHHTTHLRDYAASAGWSTAAAAIRTTKTTRAIQISYRTVQPQWLWLDGAYIDLRNDDVYVRGDPVHGSMPPGVARQVALGQPTVSVAITGSRKASVQLASRILTWQGIRGTFYIDPSQVGGGVSAVDEYDIEQLQADQQQLAVYESTDVSVLSRAALTRQFALYRGYATEHWDTERPAYMAAQDQDDPEVQTWAQRNFGSRLGSEQGINTADTFNVYDLRTVRVTPQTTLGELRDVLAEAQSKQGWVILVYDGVDDAWGPAVGTASFTKQMEVVAGSGLAVRTVGEALGMALPSQQF